MRPSNIHEVSRADSSERMNGYIYSIFQTETNDEIKSRDHRIKKGTLKL